MYLTSITAAVMSVCADMRYAFFSTMTFKFRMSIIVLPFRTFFPSLTIVLQVTNAGNPRGVDFQLHSIFPARSNVTSLTVFFEVLTTREMIFWRHRRRIEKNLEANLTKNVEGQEFGMSQIVLR